MCAGGTSSPRHAALSGQPARSAQVWLLPREAAALAFVGRNTATTNELGIFTIRIVTPGSYYALASLHEDERMLVGRVPIEIGSNDLENLNIAVAPGMDLTGKVTVDGPGEVKLDRLRVILRPRDTVPFFGGGVGPVKADGSFLVQNVLEDTYSVSVDGLSEDYYLKSVRVGADEALERGLQILRGQPPSGLEVKVSAAGARAEGLVFGEDNLPTTAIVALVPTGERRKLPHLFKNANTDELGRFVIRGIAPGEYKIFAFEEVEGAALEDPEFLKAIEDKGVSVRLTEAAVQSVELKRIPASPAKQ